MRTGMSRGGGNWGSRIRAGLKFRVKKTTPANDLESTRNNKTLDFKYVMNNI
jgi:hypothetical protein